MKRLQLFRGITVANNKVDIVIDNIKTKGLDLTEKNQWKGFVWKNLRKDIDYLFEKEDLSRDETSPNSIWIKTKNGGYREYTEGETGICFADKYGAKYYAVNHNKTKEKTVPLLISVDIDIEAVAIDGRDFL